MTTRNSLPTSTLLQNPTFSAHRSPPSGGSIVRLPGPVGIVFSRRAIESEAADVSPNNQESRPEGHWGHKYPRARRDGPSVAAMACPGCSPSPPPRRRGQGVAVVLTDLSTCSLSYVTRERYGREGWGVRFCNALPSEMRPGPGSWDLRILESLSTQEIPKQLRPIVPPPGRDGLKTKEYPDSKQRFNVESCP